MNTRPPHGTGEEGPRTPEKNLTFWKIPPLFQYAIGYLPLGGGEEETPQPASRAELWAWAAVALVLTVIGFACLELKSPMFFSHDDNFLGLGPAVMYGCRALFSGVIPAWNPFQGGGEPIAECGTPITYLPLYLAYGISRYLLGNEFLFVEVTVFFSLLLAVTGGFWAGRKWGLSPALACAVGLSFTFSGFLIVTSRSWMSFTTMSAWIPLIFGCCAPALLRNASWKWALGTGAVLGCAFHAGFSQLWAYAILFESIIIMSLFLCGAISFRKMCWNIPAVLIAVAIALPLAWVQVDFARDVLRNFASNAGEMRGIPWKALLAILVPPPGISMAHPIFDQQDQVGYGVYYYSGAVFSWGCVFLLASLLVVRWPRRTYARNIILLLAVLALLVSLGSNSPIPASKWITSLPWFAKFRQPWRHFVFLVFFSSLAGALFYERLSIGLRHRKLVQSSIAVAAIALVGAGLAVDIPTWNKRPCPVYPPLSPRINAVIRDMPAKFPQRVVPWTRQKELTTWFKTPDFPNALVGFMPSVYEVLSLSRYNTITWFHSFSRPIFNRFNSDPMKAWRAYGVQWIICRPKLPPLNDKLFQRWPSGIRIGIGDYTLVELTDPAPLAFAMGSKRAPLPVSFSAKGAVVQLPSPTPAREQVVINILGWPRFRAYADKKPVSWTADEWGRVLVSLPAGTETLEMVYEPPWGKGFGLGALFLVLALGLSGALSWWDRRLMITPPAPCGSWKSRGMACASVEEEREGGLLGATARLPLWRRFWFVAAFIAGVLLLCAVLFYAGTDGAHTRRPDGILRQEPSAVAQGTDDPAQSRAAGSEAVNLLGRGDFREPLEGVGIPEGGVIEEGPDVLGGGRCLRVSVSPDTDEEKRPMPTASFSPVRDPEGRSAPFIPRAGEAYAFSFMLKCADLATGKFGSRTLRVIMEGKDASGKYYHTDFLNISGTRDWHHYEIPFEPGVDIPADLREFRVAVGNRGGTGTFWLGAVKLERRERTTPSAPDDRSAQQAGR